MPSCVATQASTACRGRPGVESHRFGGARQAVGRRRGGMALVAGDRFPELREAILGVTIATTIAFEIAGPFATLLALHRAGRSQA